MLHSIYRAVFGNRDGGGFGQSHLSAGRAVTVHPPSNYSARAVGPALSESRPTWLGDFGHIKKAVAPAPAIRLFTRSGDRTQCA
nr:putative integron gene cassette protein [uncultured bacterium]